MDSRWQNRFSSRRWVPPGSSSTIAADDEHDRFALQSFADAVEENAKSRTKAKRSKPLFKAIFRAYCRLFRSVGGRGNAAYEGRPVSLQQAFDDLEPPQLPVGQKEKKSSLWVSSLNSVRNWFYRRVVKARRRVADPKPTDSPQQPQYVCSEPQPRPEPETASVGFPTDTFETHPQDAPRNLFCNEETLGHLQGISTLPTASHIAIHTSEDLLAALALNASPAQSEVSERSLTRSEVSENSGYRADSSLSRSLSSSLRTLTASRTAEESWQYAPALLNPTLARQPPAPLYPQRTFTVLTASRIAFELAGPTLVALRPRFKTPSPPIMDPTRLAPEPASGDKKQQAMQDAKDMYKHTVRTCEKLNIPPPPYDFLELIGKGGSGRVYKCRDRKTGDLVAVKIVDTDIVDYHTNVFDKDNTINDFQKEVATLQKLKEGQAQNINIIHDAYEIGQNLWIVSDYCTGGSVRTLMRALPPGSTGLEEHYIIPIARELLIAMVGLHAMGIIHRDIKATNVYITETGALQLGDYGVVGVTDEQTNKRKTILGTPHWMPRELLNPTQGDQAFEGYGAEIDIWAFGCTLFEMATGAPPNARLPMHDLARALLNAPRLQGEHHSQQLRDFVAFCLHSNPQQRPTAQAALEHPYVANTQKKYPTSSLVKVIERYKLWEYGGGIRQSLFLHGGAPDIPSQVEAEEPEEEDADDWNFSTSDSFDTDFERRYSHMLAVGTQGMDFQLHAPTGAGLPSGPGDGHSSSGSISNWDKLQAEWKAQQADRGGESLARLYRLSAAEYKLHTSLTEAEEKKPVDDLPLRSSTLNTEAQESVVDLDEADYDPNAPFNFDFVDATTLKARKSRRMSTQEDVDDDLQYGSSNDDGDKRATMEWTFPSTSKKISPKRATMDWTFASARPAEPDEPEAKMELPPSGDGNPPPVFRPTLKHTQTMPLGEAGDHIHATRSYRPATSPIRDSMASIIDLDMGMVDDTEDDRPGTAISTTGSHFSDMTSGNPFDLEEDPGQNERDRNRFSYHKQWQSEGGQVDRRSRRSIPMHTRGSSLSSSTDNELDRRSNGLRYRLESPPASKNGALTADDSIDLDSWPNFDQPGIERISSHESQVVHVRQQSSVNSQLNGRLGSRKLAFPAVVGPSAASLDEHAPASLLTSELEKLCGGLAESLSVAARGFELHDGLEEEEGLGSGSESGFGEGGSES